MSSPVDSDDEEDGGASAAQSSAPITGHWWVKVSARDYGEKLHEDSDKSAYSIMQTEVIAWKRDKPGFANKPYEVLVDCKAMGPTFLTHNRGNTYDISCDSVPKFDEVCFWYYNMVSPLFLNVPAPFLILLIVWVHVAARTPNMRVPTSSRALLRTREAQLSLGT